MLSYQNLPCREIRNLLACLLALFLRITSPSFAGTCEPLDPGEHGSPGHAFSKLRSQLLLPAPEAKFIKISAHRELPEQIKAQFEDAEGEYMAASGFMTPGCV